MKQIGTVRLGAAALALAGLWAALSQPQAPADLTVEKIADDLHVLVGSGGNVAVYTTQEGVILVDDKFERNVPQIVAKVKAITNQPIRYIVNTHQHGDHTGGNQKLMEMSGVDVVAHRNARANMKAGNLPGLPRIVFGDEGSVFLGGKEVRARHFSSGHTNGDAVVYFPALKTVHMGDMFVKGTPFIDYASGGSGPQWLDTLDAVLKMDADTVIPGHGPIMKKDDLAHWRQSFATTMSRIREMQRGGKSKEQVLAGLKMDDLADFQPSTFWTQRSLPALYDELAR